jgi:hypothetical protein
MSVVLAFLNASRVSQLPDVCRKYFDDDDDEFIENFAGKADDEKMEILSNGFILLTTMNIKTEKEIARFLAMSIQGIEQNYDEEAEPEPEEKEEVLRITVPTIVIGEDVEEVKPKPVMRSMGVQTDDPEPVATTPVPAPAPAEPKPKKPKSTVRHAHAGRPSVGGAFKCDCCDVGRASLGSLHNHYKSHIHRKVLTDYVKECRRVYKPDYKMVVYTLKEKSDNCFRMIGGLTDAYFDDLEDYVKKNEYDPITDIIMLEQSNPDDVDAFSKRATWRRVVEYS